MGEALKALEVAKIECRGLRSADFMSKNDVYVVVKVVGRQKQAKTIIMHNAGSSVRIDETLTLHVTDADLDAGFEFSAWDYDVASKDDLLGQAMLDVSDLRSKPNEPRLFELQLLYKGKPRGEVTCIVTLKMAA